MLTLLLGGARSGKSDMAERLAAGSGRPVLFAATMEALDDEVRARVAAHQSSRPAHWRTIEAPLDVVAALASDARTGDFVIIDCATLWVSNLLLARTPKIDDIPPALARDLIDAVMGQTQALAAWCEAFDGEVAIVSNDAGAGVVPPYPLGRVFRDALGGANRIMAARADRTYYLIAGLAIDVRAAGARGVESFGADA